MSGLTTPFVCPGCHTGDFPDFGHFCDAMDVQPGEEGQAFAAWLGASADWDGEYEQVSKSGAP